MMYERFRALHQPIRAVLCAGDLNAATTGIPFGEIVGLLPPLVPNKLLQVLE
jgi:hypothetical protein